MKLILKSAVAHLGEPGDIVSVKKGYARNYLVPKGFAIEATKANLKSIQHQLGKLRAEAEAKRARAREIAKRLGGVTLNFERKVVDADSGNLYGSVTVADVGDALEAAGFEIQRGEIHLDHPIKQVGDHQITLTLAHGVDGSVKVTIAPEGGPAEAPPEEVAADREVVESAAAAGHEQDYEVAGRDAGDDEDESEDEDEDEEA